MKNVVIVLLLIFSLTKLACSMGQRSIRNNTYVRDISKTFFWATETKGLFVTQTCIKRKKKKCKEWKKRYLDVNKDWEYIKSSKMILMNESLFLGKL